MAVAGGKIVVKVCKEQSNSELCVIEYFLPPNFPGPVPHHHKKYTESFYVVEGEVDFTVDGKISKLTSGGLAMIPPRSVHAFKNSSNEPAKMLVFMSPGGFEGYFEELFRMIKEEPSWPPADMRRLVELSSRFDTYY